jgi:iron complex transport system substrate-binding protein
MTRALTGGAVKGGTRGVFRRAAAGTLISAALFALPGPLRSSDVSGARWRAPEASLSRPAPAAMAQVIADDLGHSFRLPASTPRRIVSMAPNITEILFALGLGGHIAGVTRFCDWPKAARALPRIGGLVDPNVEIIRSLDPDLVVAFRGNPLRLVERIRKLGLPVFVLDIGRTLDDLAPLIERLGRITRTEGPAAALAAGLRHRLEKVSGALRDVRDRPKALVLLYGQGLWTCGGESYVNDLVERAGGVNVAAAMPKKWALYKSEAIIRDDPDVIFILARSAADFETGRDRLARMPGLAGVKAVRTGRIFELDENAASRFGPRLVDVLDRMAALVHPERFGGRP